jgi:hypothetical protein
VKNPGPIEFDGALKQSRSTGQEARNTSQPHRKMLDMLKSDKKEPR